MHLINAWNMEHIKLRRDAEFRILASAGPKRPRSMSATHTKPVHALQEVTVTLYVEVLLQSWAWVSVVVKALRY
jgi:hypothetical protein